MVGQLSFFRGISFWGFMKVEHVRAKALARASHMKCTLVGWAATMFGGPGAEEYAQLGKDGPCGPAVSSRQWGPHLRKVVPLVPHACCTVKTVRPSWLLAFFTLIPCVFVGGKGV